MAVDSGSVSKRSASAKKRVAMTPQKEESKPQESVALSSPAKRNKSPGIRMVGNRIYDSINGKTCHQCRQKTRDFVAACKGQRNNKPCPMMYCHKCLINRYGENAEEVADLGEWRCPRCRDICNCSICMKKRGHQPTGVLINAAKATGFSSVSEMLIKGVELLNQEKTTSSPKKDQLPKMRGKENTFDGNVDANLPNHVEKKLREIKEVGKDNTDDNTSSRIDANCSTKLGPKENGLCAPNKNQKKMKRDRSDEANNTTKNNGEILKGDGDEKKPKKSRKKAADRSDEVNNTTKNNEEILKGSGTHGDEKKPKKSRKKAGDRSDEVNNTTKNNEEILKGSGTHGDEKKPKKSRKKAGDRSDEVNNTIKNNEEILKGDGPSVDEKKPKKSRKKAGNDDGVKNGTTLEQRMSPRKDNAEVDAEENVNKGKNIAKKGILKQLERYMKKEDNADTANDKIVLKHLDADFHVEIPLPEGEVLNNVAGINLQAEDVGNALQFLEFCAVFGKVVDVKKGQAEYALQDIFQGRTGRRGKFSLSIQIHINLLSILLKEQGEEHVTLSPSHGKNSWFNALKESLSESQSILKAHGLDSLGAEYDTLTASEKLRLLNILCDEVLETEKLRDWIDDQKSKFSDKVKEAKQKIAAAKDKEKSLKQKMKDDVAQAILAKHGAPLTISEHEEIVSCINHEVVQAQAEVLESQGLFTKIDIKTSDAVRVEPMLIGSGGQAYWKLKCYGDSTMLHQSTGNRDTLTLDEKWFTIDDEGKEAVEKHICSLRGKRLRAVRRRPNIVSTVN